MAKGILMHRRGSLQDWEASTIKPADGELIVVEYPNGLRRCKIGDGDSTFSKLLFLDDYISRELLKELDKTKELFDTKLANLEGAQTDSLASVYQEISNESLKTNEQLETLERSIKNIVTTVKEKIQPAITELEDQLHSKTNRLETQHSEEFNLLAEVLDTNVKDLSSKLEALDSALNKELAELASRQEASDSSITDTMLGHFKQIYAELEDLVDDDLLILDRIKSAEKALYEKIESTKGASAEDLAALETSLISNIEDLRSNSNLKFVDIQKTFDNISNTIRTTEASLLAYLNAAQTDIKANQEKTEQSLKTVEEKINTANSRIDQTNIELSEQAKRISNLIALEPGSTTGDAELIDIRSGYNGVTHTSAGDAVRAIGNDLEALKNSLPDYIPSNAVDGLLYENNLLYLTSDGVPVSDPVEITGGGGGGGGGGGSSTRIVSASAPGASGGNGGSGIVIIRWGY